MKIPVLAKQTNSKQSDFTIYSGQLYFPLGEIVNYVLKELLEYEVEADFENFCQETKGKAKKLKERFSDFKKRFEGVELVIKPTTPEVWVHHLTARMREIIKPQLDSIQDQCINYGRLTDLIIGKFFESSESLSKEGIAPFVCIDMKKREPAYQEVPTFEAETEKSSIIKVSKPEKKVIETNWAEQILTDEEINKQLEAIEKLTEPKIFDGENPDRPRGRGDVKKTL